MCQYHQDRLWFGHRAQKLWRKRGTVFLPIIMSRVMYRPASVQLSAVPPPEFAPDEEEEEQQQVEIELLPAQEVGPSALQSVVFAVDAVVLVHEQQGHGEKQHRNEDDEIQVVFRRDEGEEVGRCHLYGVGFLMQR